MARANAGALRGESFRGAVSLSVFPPRGNSYSICEYLCMYLCVLVGLYLCFFGEDGGVAVRSSRVCVSVGQQQRWRFFFKGKDSLVPFGETIQLP